MTEPVGELPPEEMVPDEEALAFELSAVALVAGGLAAAVTPVLAGALAAWGAGVRGASLTAQLLGSLGRLSWPMMRPALEEVAVTARDLGVDRAVRDLPARERRRGRGPVEVEDLPDIDAAARARVREAQDTVRLLALDTKRDLDTVIGRVSAVRSRAEGTARAVANEGINAGTAAVAKRLGQRIIWVTERDGCLHCLAHAGWAVEPGDTFPAGLTFGDRGSALAAVPHPPLHPNCRCQVRLYDGEPGAPPLDRSRLDPAARLAAEARRSVVYGWTAHASQSATLRAMSRLLAQGAALPASVERRARELVRAGKTLDQP